MEQEVTMIEAEEFGEVLKMTSGELAVELLGAETAIELEQVYKGLVWSASEIDDQIERRLYVYNDLVSNGIDGPLFKLGGIPRKHKSEKTTAEMLERVAGHLNLGVPDYIFTNGVFDYHSYIGRDLIEKLAHNIHSVIGAWEQIGDGVKELSVESWRIAAVMAGVVPLGFGPLVGLSDFFHNVGFVDTDLNSNEVEKLRKAGAVAERLRVIRDRNIFENRETITDQHRMRGHEVFAYREGSRVTYDLISLGLDSLTSEKSCPMNSRLLI